MEETTQTNAGGSAPARPTFLTVLCILSFIAAGISIIFYVIAITAIGAVTAVASNMESMGGEAGEAAAAFSSAMEHSGPSAGLTWAYVIVGFVTVLVSLFGVIKMWKLQKQGFFMYVGASVASVVMSMIYSGFSVMGLIFPILFIVLYGLNLKHLK
ncbi:MAG: hypothetical protein JNM96_00745 [Bacteroidia bacterium]|nr:hypothetical protein [Bacteroidia bacterium]